MESVTLPRHMMSCKICTCVKGWCKVKWCVSVRCNMLSHSISLVKIWLKAIYWVWFNFHKKIGISLLCMDPRMLMPGRSLGCPKTLLTNKLSVRAFQTGHWYVNVLFLSGKIHSDNMHDIVWFVQYSSLIVILFKEW